jgi:ABC-2 type transport system ATP-binding protein
MSSTPEVSVDLRDLSKRFGDFVAVDRITLSIRKGEIFGFLGPNGAGKSTTIRMLCGIITPTSGEGTVAGYDLHTQAEQIKSSIGYMSQKFSLYEDLTVEENLDFYGGIYGLSAARREERKRWVLRMAGLEDHRHTRTGTLPVGWKQRLSLGCAVLHEPPIVFLDEPTSGVDPLRRRRFWDLIYELTEGGVTVFVPTHYMEEAEYCQRLGLVYRGELIALGTSKELTTQMKSGILEISAPGAEGLIEAVEGAPDIREAALYGTTVHAVVDDSGTAAPAVRLYLIGCGYADVHVEPINPSLEDAFVSLIEQRDRAERPLAEVVA